MTLLEKYNSIAQQHGLNSMASGGCDIETVEHSDAAAAWEALHAASPTGGWFQCQSEQQSFTAALPAWQDKWGALLAAEVVANDGSSLRIDYQHGVWRETRYRHRDDGDLLCDELSQYLHNGGQLKYRRYWRQDPAQGCVQTHACLIAVEQNTVED